jgi:hypothetical protein
MHKAELERKRERERERQIEMERYTEIYGEIHTEIHREIQRDIQRGIEAGRGDQNKHLDALGQFLALESPIRNVRERPKSILSC